MKWKEHNIETYPYGIWQVVWDKTSLASLIGKSKTIEPFRDEENILHLNDDFELEEDHAELQMIVLLNKRLKN